MKENPDLSLESREQTETRIRERFYSHNKEPNDDLEKIEVEKKILNTVDFTWGCRDIPIDSMLVYKS